MPHVPRWAAAFLAALCLLAHGQTGPVSEPVHVAQEQRAPASNEALKDGGGKPTITFSKDIPLKRDPEPLPSGSGMGLQLFFVLVVAVAAVAMYWFGKRRQGDSSAVKRGSGLLKNFGWTAPAKSSRGGGGEPLVIHRKRLDRQHTLYVIEWNNAQYLVGGAESRLSVIASTATALPSQSAPEAAP